jgi:hypothetical protein
MTRRPFAPTDDHRRQVEALAAYGVPQDEICRLVVNPASGRPIDIKTLHRHFRDELDTGMTKANARVAESLFRQAVGSPAQVDANGNVIRAEQQPVVSAGIFWLKARAGWSERTRHELSGPDGGPIQSMDLTKLDDDELSRLEAILSKVADA